MKTKILAIAALMMFLVTSAMAQDYVLKFNIINSTGEALNSVFVTQANDESWGDDIIPADIFDTGTQVEVTVPVDNNTICEFDIKITEFDGTGWIFESIDFCELDNLTFYKKDDGKVYFIVE